VDVLQEAGASRAEAIDLHLENVLHEFVHYRQWREGRLVGHVEGEARQQSKRLLKAFRRAHAA
jgi:hypothetical protein